MGLLADCAAVADAGGTPLGIATALTAQGRTFQVRPVAQRLLKAQLTEAISFRRPSAVKLGLVPDARTLATLWPGLTALHVPLVVDPVVRTSKGERLSRLGPKGFLALAGPNVWLTPNVGELGWLLGRKALPRGPKEVQALASQLLALGFAAVVVKGGHLAGRPVDFLVQPGGVHRWAARRLPRTAEKRGKGCRFASTLATALAQGQPPAAAVRRARGAVRRYLLG